MRAGSNRVWAPASALVTTVRRRWWWSGAWQEDANSQRGRVDRSGSCGDQIPTRRGRFHACPLAGPSVRLHPNPHNGSRPGLKETFRQASSGGGPLGPAHRLLRRAAGQAPWDLSCVGPGPPRPPRKRAEAPWAGTGPAVHQYGPLGKGRDVHPRAVLKGRPPARNKEGGHDRHPQPPSTPLEALEFPEPVVHVAVGAEDQDKLSRALQTLAEEDPTFRVHGDEETGQTRQDRDRRHGQAAPRGAHSPDAAGVQGKDARRQAPGGLPGDDQGGRVASGAPLR